MPRKTTAKARAEMHTIDPSNCDFALRISNTHDNGRFSAGDIAFAAQTSDINHGDYVVVKWPEGEYTISRAFDVDGVRVYVSACDDTDFAPVFADNMPFEIVGKIVGVQFKT